MADDFHFPSLYGPPYPTFQSPIVLLLSDEDRRTYRPKRCGNKDKDNSPKNLNDKNQQASSQKFRQLKRNSNFSLDNSVRSRMIVYLKYFNRSILFYFFLYAICVWQ